MSLSLSERCVPASFDLSGIFGTEILRIDATPVTNYSASVASTYRYSQPPVQLSNATFCNITVSYTHPGQNDNIIVEAWLPVDNWNGRFQAVGGSGFAAGRIFLSYAAMQGAIADGYATITTDAGIGSVEEPSPWALLSPGNVNIYNLQNLGYVSLSDEAIMGKSLINSFYGRGPDFSYWNGCSQGGRQGLMLAQLYPTLYDGIVAGAPAIYWNKFFSSVQWPQLVMNSLATYPYGCEIDAITAAAISICDGLDGSVDGVIGEVDTCLRTFDPFRLVGTLINCNEAGRKIQVSRTAAVVVNAAWSGTRTVRGKRTWYGYNPGTDLTGNDPASLVHPGAAATNCTAGACVGSPNMISYWWMRFFLAKDPNFDPLNVSHSEFDHFIHLSQQLYGSIIGTEDPDLSEFRDSGGKLVTFHGLADSVVPPKGTEHYYNAVASEVPGVDHFYRHFEIPGLGHCFGGRGGQPSQLFAQLRAWVENGTAPEQTSIQVTNLDGKAQNRVVCRYPHKRQKLASGWSCGD